MPKTSLGRWRGNYLKRICFGVGWAFSVRWKLCVRGKVLLDTNKTAENKCWRGNYLNVFACLSERINWIIIYLKNPSQDFKKSFVQGVYEFLVMLEGKIREVPFLQLFGLSKSNSVARKFHILKQKQSTRKCEAFSGDWLWICVHHNSTLLL